MSAMNVEQLLWVGLGPTVEFHMGPRLDLDLPDSVSSCVCVCVCVCARTSEQINKNM